MLRASDAAARPALGPAAPQRPSPAAAKGSTGRAWAELLQASTELLQASWSSSWPGLPPAGRCCRRRWVRRSPQAPGLTLELLALPPAVFPLALSPSAYLLAFITHFLCKYCWRFFSCPVTHTVLLCLSIFSTYLSLFLSVRDTLCRLIFSTKQCLLLTEHSAYPWVSVLPCHCFFAT